ncbi:hypothetical protein D3C87_1956010 [compost metagenome]
MRTATARSTSPPICETGNWRVATALIQMFPPRKRAGPPSMASACFSELGSSACDRLKSSPTAVRMIPATTGR